MKKKIDFVTNSSSVSFIISSLEIIEEIPKVKIEIEVDLNQYVREIIKTKEDLKDYFYKEDEEYNECLEIIEKGGSVIVLSCGSENDDPIEQYLLENGINDLKFPEGIKVIIGEGGY